MLKVIIMAKFVEFSHLLCLLQLRYRQLKSMVSIFKKLNNLYIITFFYIYVYNINGKISSSYSCIMFI